MANKRFIRTLRFVAILPVSYFRLLQALSEDWSLGAEPGTGLKLSTFPILQALSEDWSLDAEPGIGLEIN